MSNQGTPVGATGAALPAPDFVDVGGTRVAHRRLGRGDALVLLHGWPLSGLTWRKVLPALAARFECHAFDLPGAGDTVWGDATDFRFAGQAETLRAAIARLGLASYSLLAHDTGATIARALALRDAPKVRRALLIGTEIPGHRPPWIPLYQQVTRLPGRALAFRSLLRSRAFLRSGLGFGGCFVDRALIDGEFRELFVRPLVASARRMEGQIRYLQGIDWALVDALARDHARITAPTLLVWGAEDTVFPVERARPMQRQFGDCRGFEVVAGARLLVHEEKPAEVARLALDFLGAAG
jgi:haloalkane dehalogenase